MHDDENDNTFIDNAGISYCVLVTAQQCSTCHTTKFLLLINRKCRLQFKWYMGMNEREQLKNYTAIIFFPRGNPHKYMHDDVIIMNISSCKLE